MQGRSSSNRLLLCAFMYKAGITAELWHGVGCVILRASLLSPAAYLLPLHRASPPRHPAGRIPACPSRPWACVAEQWVHGVIKTASGLQPVNGCWMQQPEPSASQKKRCNTFLLGRLCAGDTAQSQSAPAERGQKVSCWPNHS